MEGKSRRESNPRPSAFCSEYHKLLQNFIERSWKNGKMVCGKQKKEKGGKCIGRNKTATNNEGRKDVSRHAGDRERTLVQVLSFYK